MIKNLFKKKELNLIILSIIVLSFAFGFNDGRQDFVFSYWISHLILVIILVTISILIIELAIRNIAKMYDCSIEYQLWGIKRYFIGSGNIFKKKIPFGIIFCILGAFISKGTFIFALIQNHLIKENTKVRSLKRSQHVSELETAIIYSIIPLTALFLVCVAKILQIDNLALINSYFAIFFIIPFPSSDAIRFLFSAKFFYLFIFIFVLISTIVLINTGIISAIIIGLLTATIFLILSLFKTYK